MCALKRAKKREKPLPCQQVSPFSLDNLFCQLKTNCENLLRHAFLYGNGTSNGRELTMLLVPLKKASAKAKAFFKFYGILTIIRVSKTTLLRSAPLFANTFAFGKRVNFLP